MSAIVGTYYFGDRVSKYQIIEQMLGTLVHRGKDGLGIWNESCLGLGHRLLWTTPESIQEKQPLISDCGNIVITADARIDNRDELIKSLDLDTNSAKTITDSDIILRAYQKWAEKCPEKLLGDFAFAIWNSNTQQLFCARDHFGVKPFYYYYSEQIFVFASEIKAILSVPEVPARINEKRIGDYLELLFHDKEITFYENILRLPPASWIKIDANGKTIQSYWSLDPTYELKLNSDAEYAAKFQEIFTEAVRCRLRSAFDVGCTLSGGLDSSSVTCVSRKLLQQQRATFKLHTFSAIFDELKECDEREYINPILEQGGIEAHFIDGDCLNLFSKLEDAFKYQDEVFYAPNWFMTWELYNRANKEGVRILLNGFDGDNVVSMGYGRLSELAKSSRWLSLAKQVWGLSKTWEQNFFKYFASYVQYYGFRPVFNRYRILRLLQRIYRFVWHKIKTIFNISSAPKPDSKPLIASEFARRIDLSARQEEYKKIKTNLGQDERKRHYRNLATGQSSLALEIMDRSMAAFGIEPRYPFWDKRLVEFCLSLPAEQKLDFGFDRVVMRRAMTDILPKKVQWRRGKTDFSSNFARGMHSFDEKQWHEFKIANQELLQKYSNVATLNELYQQFSADGFDNTQNAKDLWKIVSLISWLQYTTNKLSILKD